LKSLSHFYRVVILDANILKLLYRISFGGSEERCDLGRRKPGVISVLFRASKSKKVNREFEVGKARSDAVSLAGIFLSIVNSLV
jgi:hypothetical protein